MAEIAGHEESFERLLTVGDRSKIISIPRGNPTVQLRGGDRHPTLKWKDIQLITGKIVGVYARGSSGAVLRILLADQAEIDIEIPTNCLKYVKD